MLEKYLNKTSDKNVRQVYCSDTPDKTRAINLKT